MNTRPRRHAFTLLEMIGVLACIGILAAIAVPNFLEAQVRSRVAATRVNLVAMGEGLAAYHADYLAYPPNRMPFEDPRPFVNAMPKRGMTTPDGRMSGPFGTPQAPPPPRITFAHTAGKSDYQKLLELYTTATGDSATSATGARIAMENADVMVPEVLLDSYAISYSFGSDLPDSLRVRQYRMRMNGLAAVRAMRHPVDYLGVQITDNFANRRNIPLGYVNYEPFEGVTTCTLASTGGRLPRYIIFSTGPDSRQTIENPFLGSFTAYDPTNGTVSDGDIFSIGVGSASD
jgi:prepilin-type N-terminal cleavage/methylation domain-containing protein